MTSDADIKFLHERIDKLVREIERLKNNAAPTIPIYDATNFPQDAVEGQIAIAPQTVLGFETLDATNFPTADPHVAGLVWNNAGILTVSSG